MGLRTKSKHNAAKDAPLYLRNRCFHQLMPDYISQAADGGRVIPLLSSDSLETLNHGMYYIPMVRAPLAGHGQATGGDHWPVRCRASWERHPGTNAKSGCDREKYPAYSGVFVCTAKPVFVDCSCFCVIFLNRPPLGKCNRA